MSAVDPGASPSGPGLLEQVLERIGDASGQLAALARAYLHRIPFDTALTPDQAYQEVVGLFDFIGRREGPISVRVFNPTVATHGYDSSGTVVEVHVDDAPFLVDSVTAELQAHGLSVVRVLHPVLGTVRDASGTLVELLRAREAQQRESAQHYVLDRLLDPLDHAALSRRLEAVLGDVLLAVRDFAAMVAATDRMASLAEKGVSHYPEAEVDEAVAFLHWLTDDNFVFLGYREYQIVDTAEGPTLEVVPESGLGILSDPNRSRVSRPVPLAALPPQVRARYERGDLLVISKTNQLSTVHRRARMDYVAVRTLGPDGETRGEVRLLGLFTSKAYMESVTRIPILRRKLAEIVSAEDLIEGSHDYKAVVGLVESYPKDELFGLPTEDLRRVVLGLLAMESRAQARLFVRRGLLDRSVRIMVAMPRDSFSAELRRTLQDLFLERFGGISCDYYLSLGEGDLARLHFVVWVPEGQAPELAFEEMEAEVMALIRPWSERVGGVLAGRHGGAAARDMAARWSRRLPSYYKTSTQLAVAAGDIESLDELTRQGGDLLVGIQNETEGPEPLTRVSLYRARGKQALSDLTPALEDMGLTVVEEVPTRLTGPGEMFIHDFGVLDPSGRPLEVEQVGERMAGMLTAIWEGRAESDSLNRLVLVAGLDHLQVAILRGYHVYWRRVSPTFTMNYVNETLVRHPEIAADLVELFESRFDPTADGVGYDELRQRILDRLDAVPSLDEDRILRGFFRLIEATVRTNAYRTDRDSLTFKLRSAEVPHMPSPRPHVEVFVISKEMEGIHLRAGPLSRGGIRWSERREDYRTEVLGLMKAQVTKNAVIVPTGAKGGFVLRRPPQPEEVEAAVRAAYTVFIRGLLDVTDNLVDGEVVHPEGVRAHDGPDPYLVVAADKGTARFSDLANEIAEEYGFWLGDAFASGGATGYDHKALGITAAGAWKSLEAHFAVDGLDPRGDVFTAVGIGDMSGDVFGNGMLGSETIRLVAAFDHRHLFIDPDPDPAVSYQERHRLFSLPRSSWADYDEGLISEGGGVFPRSLKRIHLSAAARRALGTEMEEGTPAEVIRLILRAPVDLIWNGGIGTYVKASSETHEEVGDRSNDEVRIDGSELRARIVVEGGNLGLTQRGRIEYARAGGRINTDFIDNSGGVNCSDREVNLKILLREAERAGEINHAEARRILAVEADEVVEAILDDCLEQVQMLAIEEAVSAERIDSYEQLMVALEAEGVVDRDIEALPSSQEMADRARSGEPMTRPELAVLSAHAKRSLTQAILSSTLPDAREMMESLTSYFPSGLTDRFGHLMWDHPLRRELVATVVANEVVDYQGPAFVSRLIARTGADASAVVWAYRAARELAGAKKRRRAAADLFGAVPYPTWMQLVGAVDRLVATLTRWYLHRRAESPGAREAESSDVFDRLVEEADRWGPPEWWEPRRAQVAELEASGVPSPVAYFTVVAEEMVHAPDIIEVADGTGLSRLETGRLFQRIGMSLGLDRLRATVVELKPSDTWQRLARETLEDDLFAVRRHLAERIPVPAGATVDEAFEGFVTSKADSVRRVNALVDSLEPGTVTDPAPVLVVLRQVEALV